MILLNKLGKEELIKVKELKLLSTTKINLINGFFDDDHGHMCSEK